MNVELNPIWSGYTKEGLAIKEADAQFYNIHEEPFSVYGLWNPSVDYRRMPDDAATKVSPGVADKSVSPAGGRIRFATDSPYIGIRVKFRYSVVGSPHITRLAATGFDLYGEENGKMEFLTCYYPALDGFDGYEGLCRVENPIMRDYMLHFPMGNEVYDVEICLQKGSHMQKAKPYRYEKPIAFYGSSITHGCGATRPGMIYPNIVSRELDADVLCLGFSGQAKGEVAMAEYIGGLDMSAFVLDYDANASSAEYLSKTHYPFYEAVRKLQPDLPILMVTYPSLKMRESMTARRDVIMETYLTARKAGDKHVYFIDGYTLFNGPNRRDCTVDGSHPSDLGYLRMATVIGGVLKEIL